MLNYHAKQIVTVKSILPHHRSEQGRIRTLIMFRLWRHGVSTRYIAKLFGISYGQAQHKIFHARYDTYVRKRRFEI